MFKKSVARIGLLTSLLLGMSGVANAVQTDEARSNTISGFGVTTGQSYMTVQTPLLDSACLYGVLYFGAPDLSATKAQVALALSARSGDLPIMRVVYDRNTSTNVCTVSMIAF